MHLPRPRGPLTEELLGALRAGFDEFYGVLAAASQAAGEDAALALWTLYELHYRGFDDVGGGLEWDPQLLRLRGVLERDLEHRLRDRFTRPEGVAFVEDFFGCLDQQEGITVARHVHRDSDREQVLELPLLGSVFRHKES